MSATHNVVVRINGQRTLWTVTAGTTLLDALRAQATQTGAKEGCGIGECGACMVLVNGTPTVSCLVLAVEMEGATLTTIESTNDRRIARMRDAFLAEEAFQCGACTPGMIVAATRISDNATPDEIRDALSGNICRCTGYASIVRAVQRAHRPPSAEKPRG